MVVSLKQSLFTRLRAKARSQVVRVTVEVTPINNASLKEVSDLVRDVLAESCGDETSDTFKDVRLVSAVMD